MGEILDNFLKVYQLANFIKHSRLQEQRQAQQMEQERVQFQRRSQQEDLMNQLRLSDLGATEITPDIERVTGAMEEALGPPQVRNPRVKTPAGTEYYVPRAEVQQERLLDKIRAKGEAESGIAIGRAAAVEDVRQRIRAEYAKDPNLHFNTVTQGDDLLIIGSDPKTGEEKSRQVYKGGGKNSNVTLRSYTDEQTGTRITEIRDPKTGEMIRKEVEKGAVTARPARSGGSTAAPKGLSARAQTSWAQFEKAKAAVDALPAGTAEEQAKKTAALKDLQNMRDRIVLVYGNELEKGPSEGGWPDIVPKKRAPSPDDPKLKAYADKYFGGDVEAARRYAAAHP